MIQSYQILLELAVVNFVFLLLFIKSFDKVFSIMAITKSAKKEIRASKTKAVFNLRRKRAIKTIIKEIEILLKANKIDDAQKKLSQAYKALDKAAKMNTIKKNTADRKKSRLSARIKKAKSAK